MNDLTLFDDEAGREHARRSDPATSHLAAGAVIVREGGVQTLRRGTQKYLALSFFADRPRLGASDAERALGPYVDKRISDLKRGGFIEVVAQQRAASGRLEDTYEVTPLGEAALAPGSLR